MNLIFDKSLEDINKSVNARLADEGFDTSPGSIVKLITSIINSEIVDFYELLSTALSNAFVTTATGRFLDALGQTVNCIRLDGEEDEDYRVRIVNSVSILTSSNEHAIRLKILSLDEVLDVRLKNYTHGAGTFTVVPITKDLLIDSGLEFSIRQKIDETVAYGTKYHISKPRKKEVSLSIKLSFVSGTTDSEMRAIMFEVTEAIKRYIINLKLGESLIINELTQRIMEVSESILSYSCTSFKINNKKVNFINQHVDYYSKLTLEQGVESIIVS